MSASATSKKQCVTCNKSGGILICDGCQQSFCGKHVTEHRQELGVQLDGIMQEHDLLQQEREEPSRKKNAILQKIDHWEKDSIMKIQTAAETARKTLQELLAQSKERLSKISRDTAVDLRASREADDFSEHDLDRWKKQLKQFQLEMTAPSSAKLVQDQSTPPIYLITLKTNDSSASSNGPPPPTTNSTRLDTQERFLQTHGPVNLEEHGYLAKCVGSSPGFAYIRGRVLYSKGCYVIRFHIQQSARPYRIFFGCMSSKTALKENAFKSQDAVGWFGSNQVYEHGRCTSNCQKYKYYSTQIVNNDELHLILDCDNKQIRLFHERNKTTCTLSVNPYLAPFPWQYLVVLCNPDDSVRILPNA